MLRHVCGTYLRLRSAVTLVPYLEKIKKSYDWAEPILLALSPNDGDDSQDPRD